MRSASRMVRVIIVSSALVSSKSLGRKQALNDYQSFPSFAFDLRTLSTVSPPAARSSWQFNGVNCSRIQSPIADVAFPLENLSFISAGKKISS
ncbi:hypothetical protein B0H16DRAFT_1554011 [Mycena metata]|uniref:Uncharacterized protein n=1 Tax=Mycena metata TaxID=1033252 RepID=A0AAD7N7T1_9AGAR|nr:hypothetical protein B0H16DRAFT_1554011 [Mycena metata]